MYTANTEPLPTTNQSTRCFLSSTQCSYIWRTISPVQNQYGQGPAAFSKWHKFSINEIVFYTTDSNCCFNFSGFKLKSLTVKPQDENTFILNGTLSLSPNQPVALLGNKTTNEINIIDTAQQLSTGTISINNPADATFTPDGQFIYIAQPEQYTVTILNSVDYTVNTVITVGKSPISIAI